MKTIFAIIIIAITTGLNAETLSFPSFRIEIQDGWEHSIENGPGDDSGGVISLRHPNGAGSLKIRSYNAPAVVSKDMLRNITNVDSSTPLTWKIWGDYSGYQYDYLERGSFYRQWWLSIESTIVFFVYESNTESKNIEIDEINKIVNSITVNNP